MESGRHGSIIATPPPMSNPSFATGDDYIDPGCTYLYPLVDTSPCQTRKKLS